MRKIRSVAVLGLFALFVLGSFGTQAFAASGQDFDTLKREVEDLRLRLNNNHNVTTGPLGHAEALVANKYGPNARVTTKAGKLTIGGLLQIWNYTIQNDHRDYIGSPPRVNGAGLTRKGFSNEVFDNDGYRIRRAELKFRMEITKEISAFVLLDAAGGDEGNTFPGMPTNQGVVGKTVAGTATVDFADPALAAGIVAGDFGFLARSNMQNGTVRPNRILQDAYINYRPGITPHHDFTIGQFKPPTGEEGNRSSGHLDFVERSMINQFSNQRDLGIMVHGWWFGEKSSKALLHYWIGGFNTAGSFHNTFASFQNRSDDNDSFDIAWKIRLRPLWEDEKWGSIELGVSRQDGVHGEAGKGFTFDAATNSVLPTSDGLSLQETHAYRQWAWLWYRTGSDTPVRGWWLRGEYGKIKDRALPGVGSFLSVQLQPQVFDREGWYFSTGYRLSKSIFADNLRDGSGWTGMIKKFLYRTEWAFRYETFGNFITDDVVDVNETDVFKSSVYTAGVNVYWKGHNIRSQLNYMWVDEPNRDHLPVHIREVRNNVLILNTQIRW